MALLTIPTSIGGINIPSGIFSGPLSDLTDGAGSFYYQYPRDLNSATKAHSVYFTVKEVQEITLSELKGWVVEGVESLDSYASDTNVFDELSSIGTKASSWWETATQEAKDIYDKGAGAVVGKLFDGVVTGLQTGAEFYEKGANILNNQKTEIVGHIGLYMPENFNLNSAFAYDDNTSLASAMGSLPLIGGVVNSATNFISGSNEAFKLALNRAGYVFNPQKQILFQGVEFRNFSMSFTFTPYSAAEAEQVRKIVEKFRMYAAPKRNAQLDSSGNKSNMFWVPPAIFGIEFQMHGQQNSNLPKLKDCIIESIDVNYAPNGWTTHTDGAPVQTTMTIEFKEIALIGRDDISEGY